MVVDKSAFRILTFLPLFFIISPKEKIMFFFSMTTIGGYRPLSLPLSYLNFFNMEWGLDNKSWIYRSISDPGRMGLVVMNLYPSKFFRWLPGHHDIFSLAFLATLFLPVKIFSYTAIIYYPAMLLGIFYLLFMSFRGSWKKCGRHAYFLAFILLPGRGIARYEGISWQIRF